jgi:hypothetical protein
MPQTPETIAPTLQARQECIVRGLRDYLGQFVGRAEQLIRRCNEALGDDVEADTGGVDAVKARHQAQLKGVDPFAGLEPVAERP